MAINASACLTAKGRELHERLVPSVKRERKRVYKGLSNADFDAVKHVLDTIDNNVLDALQKDFR